MFSILDFFADWMQPVIGGRTYEKWRNQSFSLQRVKLSNIKLARDLENACSKKHGFLTYSEYLEIEQFGKYGYHATHKNHGFTPISGKWAPAILSLMQKNGIHEILELGPGDGSLSLEICKLSNARDYKINWYGVEVYEEFRRKIRDKHKKYPDYIKYLDDNLASLPKLNKALIISSFFIDSVPPECLINTSQKQGLPNGIVGVKVKDGILEEFILSREDQKAKGIEIDRNSLTFGNNKYNISTLTLAPMQRAYITFLGLDLIYNALSKISSPTLTVMDEFRSNRREFASDHLLTPLYLNIKNRYHFNPQRGYTKAGKFLFYYPLFVDNLTSFLKSLGMDIQYDDIDVKLLHELSGKTWVPLKNVTAYLCRAIVANGKVVKPKEILLSFPTK